MIYPDWVSKHKKKGTEVRLIKGKYYLYKISSKWDKIKKRSRKTTHEYLGRITENGLVAPKTKQQQPSITKNSIAVKEYGACSFMMKTAEQIKDKLVEIFATDADRLIAIAVLRAINQCPFKRVEHLEEHLHYVIPLKRNSSLFDNTPIRIGDKSKFDGHFLFNKRPIWHYSKKIDDKKKIIVFIDNDLKTEEEKDYLQRIENNLEGYTMENFLAKQYSFGTIIIITNVDKSTKEVYEILKSRNNIEVAYYSM